MPLRNVQLLPQVFDQPPVLLLSFRVQLAILLLQAQGMAYDMECVHFEGEGGGGALTWDFRAGPAPVEGGGGGGVCRRRYVLYISSPSQYSFTQHHH